MSQSKTGFPNYKHPPVNEVVFGVQFTPLSGFTAPHTGILWEKLDRTEFPKYQEMAPLAPFVERFDKPPFDPKIPRLESMTRPPLPRSFFISNSEEHLIQVQQSRFLQNWRKQKPEDAYPRYADLLPKFVHSWEIFNEFVANENLGPLELNQYELTYVNHIPRGQGWENIADIKNVFPDFVCRTYDPFLPEPETVNWRKTYRLPDNKGRLHVSLDQAFDTRSEDTIFVLNLTARGFDENGMNLWFDLAREWIVKGFDDLSSNQIKKQFWKKIS